MQMFETGKFKTVEQSKVKDYSIKTASVDNFVDLNFIGSLAPD